MKIIVVDSGSTKADWIGPDEGGIKKISTHGINPATGSGLSQQLSDEIAEWLGKADKVYFYAAGGVGELAMNNLQNFMAPYLDNPSLQLWMGSDMLGAARAAAGDHPAIVGILGTGSNSCLYDGSTIIDQIPSLGYLLSDEGSGNHIGKLLLKAWFYRYMNPHDADLFQQKFNPTREAVIQRLYGVDGVSAYLAQFSAFLQICSKELRNNILNQVFTEFAETRILKYNDFSKFDLYFAGSIAAHYREELQVVCQKFGLTIAGIVDKPIESLLQYHLSREFK